MLPAQSNLPAGATYHAQASQAVAFVVGSPITTANGTRPSTIDAKKQATNDESGVTAGSQSPVNLPIEQLSALVDSLRKQLDQSQRMAILGELTAITTHEFNNLLMTMLNYAKIGLRHKDESTRDKALQRIFDAAGKASRLTCGVLALARNRSGAKEPTDLRRVIEDSVLLLEREFRKYQIQLDVELGEVPLINGIGNELQRVVINLLVNARQATPSGGQVRISLKVDKQSGDVLLAIRDNGSGISHDVLPKIFDPYFTTKSGPDASGRGGNGLGLAACKEVIDLHGGRIRVESAVGKGTQFTIRLPKLVP
mgnify:CR=1 FL=1